MFEVVIVFLFVFMFVLRKETLEENRQICALLRKRNLETGEE